MQLKRILRLAGGVAFGCAVAWAGSLSFTCDPNVDSTQAGTCSYLNSTVAGYYTSTFTNVNANIYIQMGITGLGSSTPGFYDLVNYSTYLSALTSTASGDAVDTAALAALNLLDTPAYGTDKVELTSALGTAIGITGLTGTTSGGSACTVGTSGCYNGIITVTTPANLSSETSGTQGLYWDQTGGTQPASDYDFYSVVEHEADEILGTSSCIDTQSATLTDGCDFGGGSGTPSAVDLFRYNSSGNLALNNTYKGTSGAPAGAYFSYNGGVSNGVPNGAVYNTLPNGRDYADFTTNCSSGPFDVQNGSSCVGTAPHITTDGGGEVNILDAIGYNRTATTPEPGTMLLLGFGLAAVGIYRRRGL